MDSLTQAEADTLIQALKVAVRESVFEWLENHRHDEDFVAVGRDDLKFILTLNRNPFEIRLHLRTRAGNIGLIRIDGNRYHANPDGTELRDVPHMHVFREGHGLAWAQPIDWYDPEDPIATLERFLVEAHARFPHGIQLTPT